MPILSTSGELAALFERVRSVAVVGVSPDPARASNEVASYLVESSGWEVWFVNPMVGEIAGRTCYPRLADLPTAPDLINVFRRASKLGSATHEAIGVGASALWFQLGLRDDALAAVASGAGLDVVQDRCLMVDHARWTR
jgi:hypothetical protein